MADFPPVSTAEWEAAIAKDLKGADYEKKLVWQTEEGIAVRPYYRHEDLPSEVANVRERAGWHEAQDWEPPAGAIRADWHHEAGATAVQELGLALAEAVEWVPSRHDAQDVVFVFAVGSNYFMEIAKLRAIRIVWTIAAESLGVQSAAVRILVRTARFNKSLLDPYTNLLRVTTEALSAVIGGCDSLSVEPFGVDSHLALNVQRILREEAHLDKVADPAGGSYYIESLTDSLGREAWKLFQAVEAEGGWSAAVRSGYVEQMLTASREAKAKAVALRRRVLVGVNNYPNLQERMGVGAEQLGHRLATPFEALHRRTEMHAQRTGRRATVLLLKRGDLKMKMARANFCLNFFGCAGFDVIESGEGADLIVLCSSDSEYLAFAQEVCPSVQTPVLVAGFPRDQVEQLQAAGVQGFVHVNSNVIETLSEWQDRLGMPAIQEQ